MDLVKTYLTVNIEANTKVTMISQAKMIVSEQGFLGLYRGIGLSTIGIAPFIGIKLTSFDMLMSRFAPAKGDPNTIYWNLLLGATAGTIAVTFTYPVDLTRRLL
jgi:solute carrier family 25 phosphate transporter 23/24/25/41